MKNMVRCVGKTKAGVRCKKLAPSGSAYCSIHSRRKSSPSYRTKKVASRKRVTKKKPSHMVCTGGVCMLRR